MARLAISILGGFEATLDGAPVVVPKKKARALLAYLSLNAGRSHSREKIAALLWGNSGDAQARASLRQSLSSIRRALPNGKADGLVIDGETFLLDAGKVAVDAAAFLRLISDDSVEAMRDATKLYRGDLLEDFHLREPSFQEWLDTERARMRRLGIDAHLRLLGHLEHHGELEEAIAIACRLLEIDSLLEDVHQSLMRLYFAQGRRSLALQQYDNCQVLLRDELEVEPAEETTDLYQKIRDRRSIGGRWILPDGSKSESKLTAVVTIGLVNTIFADRAESDADFQRLRGHQVAIAALIDASGGRKAAPTGARTAAVFETTLGALRFVIKILEELERRECAGPARSRLQFRAGLDVGDVLVSGDVLMGDGLVVATGLESMASPGGLCVSESVVTEVRDRAGLNFIALGQKRMGTTQRIGVYRVPLDTEAPIASPFRGLNHFDVEHAASFFGRTQAVAAALTRLSDQAAKGSAFLLIYGMSGVGKSSLLRAGLISATMDTASNAGPSHRFWCIFRPSQAADPLSALLNALLGKTAVPGLARTATRAELCKLLATEPQQFIARLREAIDQGPAPPGRQTDRAAAASVPLLVAVDQMEEIFSAEPSQRSAIVGALAALARSGFASVVATMRADVFHRCSEIPGLSELKDGLGSYELLPPTATDIARIIREPAAAVGVHYENHPEQGSLAEVLQQAAMRNPGSLPLLEFLLDSLFESGKERHKLTFADYHALGGLGGAIARRADEVVNALPKKVQDALPSVIRALTTFRLGDQTVGGKTTRYAEIAASPERAALVDALIEARLLVSDEDASGQRIVQLAHESLLSHWPRANRIVGENREFLEIRARLRTDATRWSAEGRNPDLLLPRGKRLAEAQELVALRRSGLDADLIDYVDASVAAETRRLHALEKSERRRLEAEAEQQRLVAKSERKAGEMARDGERAARRLVYRTRIAAGVTVVLAVIAAAGAVIGFSGQREATRQAIFAETQAVLARAAEADAAEQARSAITARNDAVHNQALYLANLSRQQTDAGDAMTGALLALEALPNPESPQRQYTVQAEIALYQALNALREVSVLTGHSGPITAVEFAAGSDQVITGSRDGTARIWNLGTGLFVELAGHKGGILAVDIAADGQRAVTASRDKTTRLWDAGTGQVLLELTGHGGDIHSVEFSPDEARILTGSRDRTARIWNASNGQEVATLQGHRGPVPFATYAPNGEVVATVSWDRTARLWDAASGREMHVLEGHKDRVLHAAFDSSSRRLATVANDGTVRVWNTETGALIHALTGHGDAVYHVAFSPDDRLIATASADGTARLWDAETGDEVAVLRGHTAAVLRAKFDDRGTYLVTISLDGTARLWDVARGSEKAVLGGHESALTGVAFSPDGSRLATVSTDSSLRLWVTKSAASAITLRHDAPVIFAQFDPAGDRVVTASTDGVGRVWDSDSGALLADLKGHTAQIRYAEFSPDGKLVVTSSEDRTARLWDPVSGEQLKVLVGHSGLLPRAIFSPGGEKILTTSRDGTARLWQVSTGDELTVLTGASSALTFADYGPLSLVAVGTTEGSARLWDVESGAVNAIIEVSTEAPVVPVDFSPDGKRLFACALDGAGVLWNVSDGSVIKAFKFDDPCSEAEFDSSGDRLLVAGGGIANSASLIDGRNGAQLATLTGHGAQVRTVNFSPNGLRAVTGDVSGEIRVWEIGTRTAIVQLQAHSAQIWTVRFSPDGGKFVSASDDGTAKIFTVFPTTEDLVRYARSVTVRELTPCQKKKFYLSQPDDEDCTR